MAFISAAPRRISEDSTEGKIKFHDFIGDKSAVLFSHPKDFTPFARRSSVARRI